MMYNPNAQQQGAPGAPPPGQAPPGSGGYPAPNAQYGGGPTPPGQQGYGAPPPGQQMQGMPPPQQYAGAPPGGAPGYGMPPPQQQMQQGMPPQGMPPPPSRPPMNQQQGQMGGPPGSGGGGAPMGQPPMGQPPMGQPPMQGGMGAPGPSASPSPAKPVAQFYSMAGGKAPQPIATLAGPPSGVGGPPWGGAPPSGMGPPSTMGMPPPPGGAGQFGPPGSMQQGMPPPPGGGPGMGPPGSMQQGQAPYAGQQYGAPPPGSMQGMPDQFGGGQPVAHGGQLAAGAPGGIQAEQQSPLPVLDDMDLSLQCDPKYLRSSVGRIVNTQAAANNAKLPLGLVVSPMAGAMEDVEVVDFGSTGIIRCKRCRTYINPFATWTDGGRRWCCNMCGMLNDVPSSYFSQLDSNGRRRDQAKRPELSNCSVEFVAPGDYMVRPPQPPVYFFCIDVSALSISSGMLVTACAAIKESLDTLMAYPRVQVGFITFDSSIHFYNLKSTLTAPQMLVVSDTQEIIIPNVTDDLLVPLEDSRAVIETLLESLPTMFGNSQIHSSCTGPALQAAKRVISHLGGKLVLLQSSLPSQGEGTLKPRENPRLMGTDKEHVLLSPENQWYKENAIDFSRLQICVDIYLFSGQYTDVSTLSVLPKYTGGTCYYYPAYNHERDSQKFHKEMAHNLTRPTGFESVMRVRATRGIRISNFYGNHYIRGQDLLALPNCTSDSCFSLDFTYDEPVLSAQAITVQAALLYTSSAGERRIRVHTMIIPVTQSAQDMHNSLDIDVAVNIMAKQAIDIAQKSGLEVARRRVHENTADILRCAKQGPSAGMQGGYGGQYGVPQQQQAPATVEVPQTLSFLPLYSMSLMKNVVLRGGTDIRLDERAFFQMLVQNMSVEQTLVFIYPRMFGIHDMDDRAGRPCDNPDEDVKVAGPFNIRLPATSNLTSENLTSDGIFLLETGSDLFLWVGSSSNPLIIQSLFGVVSLQGIDMSNLKLLTDTDDFAARFFAIVTALRSERTDRHMMLHKIKEGDGYAEAFFGRFLVEDRANFPGGTHTYSEYHSLVSR